MQPLRAHMRTFSCSWRQGLYRKALLILRDAMLWHHVRPHLWYGLKPVYSDAWLQHLVQRRYLALIMRGYPIPQDCQELAEEIAALEVT